jgi:hypothetical protein
MSRRIPVLIAVALIPLACGGSNEPEPNLLFSRMQIQYFKYGGYIETSKIFIYPNGRLDAYVISHNKVDTLGQASIVLSNEDRNDLARLFDPFSTFDPYYEPEHPLTDQNYHTTILIYEGVPDTVTVYMPDQADIPQGLRNIINEMESLLEYLFG